MNRDTYDRVAAILEGHADSWLAVQAVDAHREHWRPAHPSVLLLAESHVFTDEDELVEMRGADEPRFGDLPDTFARFIYCLGYGEPRFIGHPMPTPTRTLRSRKNNGSPQFWKLLWSSVNDIAGRTPLATSSSTKSPIEVLKSHTTYERRIRRKLQLLEELRERGVWLVDASIVALYRPGGTKPSAAQQRLAIQTSWDLHVRDVVREASPSFTIVIGKGVARALGDRIDQATSGQYVVLPQPQARLSREALVAVHRTYYEVCREHCGGVGLRSEAA